MKPTNEKLAIERRTRFGKVRWTVSEYRVIEERAAQCGLSVSEFVRRAALNRRMTPIVDTQMVSELRRIGGMLKHLYPNVVQWTTEEKARYWRTRDELLALAKSIEARL